MLQPSPALHPHDSDIVGDVVSADSEEYRDNSGHAKQEAAHDRSSPQSETLPDYSHREIPTKKLAVGNGETEAGGYNSGK